MTRNAAVTYDGVAKRMLVLAVALGVLLAALAASPGAVWAQAGEQPPEDLEDFPITVDPEDRIAPPGDEDPTPPPPPPPPPAEENLEQPIIGPTEDDEEQPEQGETVVATFELAVEGTPPEDATFFGYLGYEPIPFQQLTDPDGDGVYTASTPQGLVGLGDKRPVRIVQGTGTTPGDRSGGPSPGLPGRILKDFGEVTFDEDATLSASVSFDGEEPPSQNFPKVPLEDQPETSPPVDAEDPPPGAGASPTGPQPPEEKKASGSPGSGRGAKTGGSGSGTKAETKAGGTKAKASEAKKVEAKKGELPRSGGAATTALLTLGTGALLVGGGLAVRRKFAR